MKSRLIEIEDECLEVGEVLLGIELEGAGDQAFWGYQWQMQSQKWYRRRWQVLVELRVHLTELTKLRLAGQRRQGTPPSWRLFLEFRINVVPKAAGGLDWSGQFGALKVGCSQPH